VTVKESTVQAEPSTPGVFGSEDEYCPPSETSTCVGSTSDLEHPQEVSAPYPVFPPGGWSILEEDLCSGGSPTLSELVLADMKIEGTEEAEQEAAEQPPQGSTSSSSTASPAQPLQAQPLQAQPLAQGSSENLSQNAQRRISGKQHGAGRYED
jgi:hypothetical protein